MCMTSLLCVYVLNKTCKWEVSRRSRAVTAKKCTDSVIYVQGCCYTNRNPLLSCRSCCRRRRCCLSSVLSHPTEQIVDRACEFLSSCRCPSCFSNNFYNLNIGLPKLQNN